MEDGGPTDHEDGANLFQSYRFGLSVGCTYQHRIQPFWHSYET